MEEMLRRDLSLGGEQSGHIIFSDYLFTGDGLATALNVLRTMAATGRALADLASELTTYPQVLMNLRVQQKVDLQTVPAVAAVMAARRIAARRQRAACWCATPAPSRCCASCSKGRTRREIRRWGQEIVDAVKQHWRADCRISSIFG